MKCTFFVVSFCWLCLACNSLHVAQNRTASTTHSLGVEWPATYADENLQPKLDAALNRTMENWNRQGHLFTVHRKGLRDKDKDYVTLDLQRTRVVGKGGKIAGYILTPLGMIALPAAMIAGGADFALFFYYWPEHKIQSDITLSPNLSDERRNHKAIYVTTGALFASTDKQVTKLVNKYTLAFEKTLLTIETQLNQH